MGANYDLYDADGNHVAHLGKKSWGWPFTMNLIAILRWATTQVTDPLVAFKYWAIVQGLHLWELRERDYQRRVEQRGGIDKDGPPSWIIDASNEHPNWKSETLSFPTMDRQTERPRLVTVTTVIIPKELLSVDELFSLLNGLTIRADDAVCGDDAPISIEDFRKRIEFPENLRSGECGRNWTESWNSIKPEERLIRDQTIFRLEGLPISIDTYGEFS